MENWWDARAGGRSFSTRSHRWIWERRNDLENPGFLHTLSTVGPPDSRRRQGPESLARTGFATSSERFSTLRDRYNTKTN